MLCLVFGKHSFAVELPVPVSAAGARQRAFCIFIQKMLENEMNKVGSLLTNAFSLYDNLFAAFIVFYRALYFNIINIIISFFVFST